MTPGLTNEEFSLLGLSVDDELPEGGETFSGVHFRGSGSSDLSYRHDVERALRCKLQRGTFNIRTEEAVVLQEPARLMLACEAWHAVPVVLGEAAIGVHAWRAAHHDDTFLEVFSPVSLTNRLRVSPGGKVFCRLLSGRWLNVD